MKRVIAFIITAAMIFGIVPIGVYAQDEASVLTLKNDYLAYDLNTQTGAFMIRTLEGHPQKARDNNMPLLFDGGFQTSYTTVRIDGEDYIFGKSYGFLGLDSSLSEPVLDQGNQTLTVKWRIRDIEVTQLAELKSDPENPLCGNIGLRYIVKNLSGSDKTVGIRVLLDNALGDNDAPYAFAGAQSLPVFYESEFTNDTLPDQIRFVDNYLNSNVMSYAVLNSWNDGEAVTPDRAVVGHWTNLADSRWDYSPNEGLRFTSTANSLKTADTASLYYFDPVSYQPDSEKTLEMMYGIGDFSSEYSQDNINVSISFEDLPELNQTKDGYADDGVFRLIVKIDNTVDNAQAHQDATIYLSYDEELIEVLKSPSQNSDYAVGIGSIAEGQILTYEWTLRAKEQTYYMSSEFVTSLATNMTNVFERSYILLPSVKGNLPEFTIDTVAPTEVYYKGSKMITLKGSYSAETLKASVGKQWGIYLENIATGDAYHVKAADVAFIGEREETISIRYEDDLPLGQYRVVVNFQGGLSEIFGGGTGKIIPDQTILVSNNPALVTKSYGVIAILRRNAEYGVVSFETEEEFDSFTEQHNLRDKKTPELEIMVELRGAVKKFDDGVDSFYYADPTADNVSINNIIYYGNTDSFLYIDETDKGVTLRGDGDLSIIGGMTFFKWGFELPFENGRFYSHSVEKVEDNELFKPELFSPITIKYTGSLGIVQNIAGFLCQLNYGILTEDWEDEKGYYSISFGGKIGINFFLNNARDTVETNYIGAPLQNNSDSRNLAGMGPSADISDILFGLRKDGDVGFKGINATVGVGLPEDYFGSSVTAGPEFELTINTIDNIYSLNGSVGLYMIECEGALSVKMLHVTDSVQIPVPDELRFKLQGDQAVRIVPPFFSVYMLGGGISDIYDTVQNFRGENSGLPPLTFSLQIGVEAFELLRAGGDIYISPRGLGGELEFGLANIPAVTLRGLLDAQWESPFHVTLTGQIELFQALIGGATVHFENDLVKGSVFARLQVPENVPIIGGDVIADAEGYISNQSVGAGAKFLNTYVSVVYYWDSEEVSFGAGGGAPSVLLQSLESEKRQTVEPEIMSNIKKLKTEPNKAFRLMSSNVLDIPVSAGMKSDSALFLEIPFTGAAPEAGEITINGRPAIESDASGGGSFMIKDSKIILSIQREEYEELDAILVDCSNGDTVFDISNYSVYGVGGLARITSASTNRDGSKINYTVGTEELKEKSELNVFLTDDPEFKEKLAKKTDSETKEEAGTENTLTPLNHTPVTGAGISAGSMEIPDTLPSGTYYPVYILSTEGESSTTYVDKSAEIIWNNTLLPSAPSLVNLTSAGNGAFKVSIDGLDPEVTDVFVELKDENGDPVRGYEMLRFSAETLDDIYLGTGKSVKGFTGGMDGGLEPAAYEIPPLTAGKQYFVTVTPARYEPGMETVDGWQTYNENRIYYGKSLDSAPAVMPQINEPKLTAFETQDTLSQGDAVYLTGESYRASYTFDQPVDLSLNINGSVYDYTDTYKNNWDIQIPVEDGEYYVTYTARNQQGDICASDAAAGEGVYSFKKDTTPPMLYVQEGSTVIVYGNSAELSGVSERGAVISAGSDTVTADEQGRFKLSLPFDEKQMKDAYYITAKDAAGNESYLQVAAVNGGIGGLDSLEITCGKAITDKTITVPVNEPLDLRAEGSYLNGENRKNIDVTGHAEWTILYNGASAVLEGSVFKASEEGEYVVRAQLAGATYMEGDGLDAERYSALEDIVTIKAVTSEEPEPTPSIRPGTGGGLSQSKIQRDLNELVKKIGSNNIIKVIEAYPSRQTSVKADDNITVIVPMGTVGTENRIVMHKKLEDGHEEALLTGDRQLSGQFTFEKLYSEELKKNIVITFDYSKLDIDGKSVGLYKYNSYFDSWELVKEESDSKTAVTCRIDDINGQYMFMSRADEKEFADVTLSHWAARDIYRLTGLSIIDGYPDGLFAPENPVTRAELMALVLRMLKVDVSQYDETVLDTLDTDDIQEWAVPYIKAGFALGIMNGIGTDGGVLAGADMPVSRMDAFVLIYRAVPFEVKNDERLSFTDEAQLPEYAYETVLKMASKGIVNGYPDGSIRGENSVTRAEAASVLSNWMDIVLSA